MKEESDSNKFGIHAKPPNDSSVYTICADNEFSSGSPVNKFRKETD